MARGAAGRINFRNVLEVRQSNVSGCPDNTIEIVTPGRIYTIVPSGEDNSDVSFDRWMNELINAADVYGALYVEAQKAGKLFKSDAVVAVILVKVVFISSFLFYCLLLNHSFSTNPNRMTNCFQLLLLLLQLYKLHLLNAFVYF